MPLLESLGVNHLLGQARIGIRRAPASRTNDCSGAPIIAATTTASSRSKSATISANAKLAAARRALGDSAIRLGTWQSAQI